MRGGEAARVPAAAMALFFRSSGPGKGKISECGHTYSRMRTLDT
jgi:hypothetical protein